MLQKLKKILDPLQISMSFSLMFQILPTSFVVSNQSLWNTANSKTNAYENITTALIFTADMRLVSAGVRAQRAAEPSEPEAEEVTEPVHHEDSHPEHHEHSHPEHHPGHDYNHMKEKFMNEITHLPSKPLLGNKLNLLKLSVSLWVFFWKSGSTPIQMSLYFKIYCHICFD